MIELLKRMLCVDPRERISARECLKWGVFDEKINGALTDNRIEIE